ncbi:MAG: N-acetylmuramoyl-L-alanine amidase [Paludibacteraceae bacterium]|nr:N-acetylmuramoyl-L-alanine amidase [Paludibacteraceae bacterium]
MRKSFYFFRFLYLTFVFLASTGLAYSLDKPFIVVIDAGHGGKDAGAIGYTLKLQEKSVNLKTALKLGALLEKEPGVKVIYTRKKDVFIPLDDRAQIANKAKADLFISIHANAAENRSAKGTETYTLGSSSANLDVAMRENSVILYESDYKTKYKGFDNSSESYIMFDFIQSKYIEQSLGFASSIEKQFQNINRTSRGVKQAGFWVLKQTSMPAVLVELGYLSNKEEEAFLSKDANIEKFAKSIHKAFVSYKSKHDKKNGVSYQEEVKKNNESANVSDDASKKTVEDKKDDKAKAEETDKQTSKDSTKVVVEEKKQDEIRYAVQFCSSSTQKPLDCRDFKGFVPAREFIETGTYKYKYVYGDEKTFQEGLKLRDEVKKKFPDAFLVVIKNGVKLPMNEARNYYK